MSERISMAEWSKHFIELLEGMQVKKVTGWGIELEREEIEEISREEFKGLIRKLKGGKAPWRDGLISEVWKYCGEQVEEWARRMCNRVWRGEEWPEE